eukprot:174793_1
MNGLKLPKESEEKKEDELEHEDDSMIAWINSFGLRNRVDDLDDITSGIVLLRILDKLKRGCVQWKKAQLKVKHKFDRVVNCNYAIDLCEKKLGFHFVNVSGTDIVDHNKNMINSILWRLMRYQSVKILADLQFGGKNSTDQVTNSDIIKWCNEKLTISQNKMKCKKIKSLNDSSLTT